MSQIHLLRSAIQLALQEHFSLYNTETKLIPEMYISRYTFQTREWENTKKETLGSRPNHSSVVFLTTPTLLDTKQKNCPYRQVDTDIRAIQQRYSTSDNRRGISSCRDVRLCTLGFPEPSFLSMLTARAPAQSPPQETQHDCALMGSNLKKIREECEFQRYLYPHTHTHALHWAGIMASTSRRHCF